MRHSFSRSADQQISVSGALFPGGPSVSGASHLLVLGDAALTLRAATAVAPGQIMASGEDEYDED